MIARAILWLALAGAARGQGMPDLVLNTPALQANAHEELKSIGLLAQKGTVYLHRSKGCGRCSGTGFRGRVALYEVLPVSAEIRRLIDAPTDEIFTAAVRAGMTTLRQDGIRLCLEGVSALAEIRRVTGDGG